MDGVSVDIHEDTTEKMTLLTILTSDANVDDSVSCEVDEANSVPANNGRFAVEESFPGSEGIRNVRKRTVGHARKTKI